MKRIPLIEQYYALSKQKKYLEGLAILKKMRKREPNSFWILTCISDDYYELRQYEKALRYAEKAYAINPNSPIVLWTYAGALYIIKETSRAIELWQKIIDIDEYDLAYNITTEGLKWARGLKNDCVYRIGITRLLLGDNESALFYIKLHLSKRQRGLPSLYTKKEVLTMLAEAEKAKTQQF